MSDFREEEALGKVYDSRLARRLFRYLRPYRGLVTVAALLTIPVAPLAAMGPKLFEIAVDRYFVPVLHGQITRMAAVQGLGWISLLTLMATISLNLGLLNLMPIPVLDGGHIFIMALEGLARRDFSIRVKEKMLLAGFVVILMLMVTVIYNDLTRISWIERLMPWR